MFPYVELAAATEGFNARHLLGSSGFGRTYVCTLAGKNVVVKRLHELQVKAQLDFVAVLFCAGSITASGFASLTKPALKRGDCLLRSILDFLA